MSKLKYLLITLLLAALIVPVLWSAARGSLFKVSAPASKGLVGHWALDGVTGAKDKTPYANNGTGAGGVTIGGATDQHGQAGRATTFDGTDDAISIPDSVSLSPTVASTISVWVKANSLAGSPFILDKSYATSYWMQLSATGNVQIGWQNQVGAYLNSANGEFVDGTWYHIVGTFDTTTDTIVIYKNGSAIQTKTDATGSIGDNALPIILGQNNALTTTKLNGSIADVRIYNRALSATEVSSLYSSYRPKIAISSLQKGLVGDWDLSQTSLVGTATMADKTPYANNLTLVNSPTSATDRHGQSGKALTFNGTTQYAWKSVAAFRNSDSQGTAIAWIKLNGLNATQVILRIADETGTTIYMTPLRIDSTNVLSTNQANGDAPDLVLGSTVLTTGVWYHIANVSNGTAWSLYVNGVAESLTVSTGANTGDWFADVSNTDNFTLGVGKFNTLSAFFNGVLADVKLYSRALSAAEILQDYNSYNPKIAISSLYKGLVLDMPLAQADLKSATTIADKTPNSNTGTLVASPTFTTDRHGQASKAMALNGSSQYVQATKVRNPLNDFSISAWVKLTTGAEEIIYMEGTTAAIYPYYQFRVNGTGSLSVASRNDANTEVNASASSTAMVSNGVWTHVAVTKTGTTLIYYINGLGETVSFSPTGTYNNLAHGVIGALKRDAIQSYLNGSIHSVKVWNRALSAAEVGALYQSYK